MTKRIRVPIGTLLARSNQGEGEELGLKCPKCHCVQFRSNNGGVRNTRKILDGVKRYRECRNCGHVWVTVEM
jgi:hypothetical protein